MSEDWKVGDKALCVSRSQSTCPRMEQHVAAMRIAGRSEKLVPGRVYTVNGVTKTGTDGIGLLFIEVSDRNPHGFCVGRFRKIKPSTQTIDDMIAATKRPVRAEERIDG